jgi:cytochrome c
MDGEEEEAMPRTLVAVAILLAASLQIGRAQDVAAGEQAFRRCTTCHEVGPEATNRKVGPVLNGLDGRKSGTAENYGYSDANKNSGIVWNAETFDNYIRNPQAVVPGTKMAFIGMSDPKERADLWAYLKQFNSDGSTK